MPPSSRKSSKTPAPRLPSSSCSFARPALTGRRGRNVRLRTQSRVAVVGSVHIRLVEAPCSPGLRRQAAKSARFPACRGGENRGRRDAYFVEPRSSSGCELTSGTIRPHRIACLKGSACPDFRTREVRRRSCFVVSSSRGCESRGAYRADACFRSPATCVSSTTFDRPQQR